MHIQHTVELAPYTSFEVGGPAEQFALVGNADELIEALQYTTPDTQLWTIGYGSNTLISDQGLPGMTLCIRGGSITVDGTCIIADAGAWWDDVVVKAIEHNLWGIECMSEIPGSVGGSTYINITAYGQSLGQRTAWIDVWDRSTSEVKRLNGADLEWGYKSSLFQTEIGKQYIILRICLDLSTVRDDELTYQKAVDVADELGLSVNSLTDRRQIITEARRRAGSLWQPKSDDAHTVGSFFRNPTVPAEAVASIVAHDESGKTAEQIRAMNKSHGGDEQRVSAAHVMLAAGYQRGQSWGHVKLNEQNLLKIEALDGATAQDIYDVAMEITTTVKEKLNITLQPEAKIIGDFSA